MSDSINNVIKGFSVLCKENGFDDETLLKVVASITAFAMTGLDASSVNTPSGLITMDCDKDAQIKQLREALDWAVDYTPFSGCDSNIANKALAATEVKV